MQYGLMFFSSDSTESDKYGLVMDLARQADQRGFSSIWIPERHFDRFGGIFPNPVVVHSAIAMVTKNIRLCAGSLVSPLHNDIRILEDWSVVDNLSKGRIGISFAPGWHVNDFALAPGGFAGRDEKMRTQIDFFRSNWRSREILTQDGKARPIKVRLFPDPVQESPPIWITSGGHRQSFEYAGEIGAKILTHLISQDLKKLEQNIAAYTGALAAAGHGPSAGGITLMLHTFLADTDDSAREIARSPLEQYLMAALRLQNESADSGLREMSDDLLNELVNARAQKYLETGSLVGSVKTCAGIVEKLTKIGVTEIACLKDFGIESEHLRASFQKLCVLKDGISTTTNNLTGAR